MVTRDIKAGTPTQVNSDKIGVQVAPAEVEIAADLTVDTVTVTQRYKIGDDILGRMFVDSLDNIFYNTLNTVSIEETTYYIHKIVGDETETNYYCTKTAAALVPTDPVYVMENESLTSFSTVDHLLDLEGEGVKNDPTTVLLSGTTYDIMHYPTEEDDNLFLTYFDEVQEKTIVAGWIRSIVSTSEEGAFFRDETQPYWPDYVFQWTDGKETPTYVWTSSDRPAVGDLVITSLDYPEWHTSEVKSVTYSSESDPCTVSYSVTGEKKDLGGDEVWTVCDTQLTDRNNVICNIPRYLYLKFSQDVTITEE